MQLLRTLILYLLQLQGCLFTVACMVMASSDVDEPDCMLEEGAPEECTLPVSPLSPDSSSSSPSFSATNNTNPNTDQQPLSNTSTPSTSISTPQQLSLSQSGVRPPPPKRLKISNSSSSKAFLVGRAARKSQFPAKPEFTGPPRKVTLRLFCDNEFSGKKYGFKWEHRSY